jgi:hypothetical protein
MDLIEFTHTAGVYHPTQVDHGSVGVSGHKKQEEGNYLSSSLEVFRSSQKYKKPERLSKGCFMPAKTYNTS